ncbi:hypothetical protein ACPA9J_18935 [Pseudomonas aeruginosa]
MGQRALRAGARLAAGAAGAVTGAVRRTRRPGGRRQPRLRRTARPANRPAHYLRDKGVGPDVRVARSVPSVRRNCWSVCWRSSRRAAPTCRWTRTTPANAWPTCSPTAASSCY